MKFIIFLAVLMVVSIRADDPREKKESKDKCPTACGFMWRPVCGSDGETYANRCVLKAQKKCTNSKLYVVKDGQCGDCSSPPASGFCRAYFPKWHFDYNSYSCKKFVYGGCGGNGNSYNTMEECEQQCMKPCPDTCPNTYDPVCGSDGNTYPNNCQLQAEAYCGGGNGEVVMLRKGECLME